MTGTAGRAVLAEVAPLIQEGVETDQLVAGVEQQRDEDRSDVAVMACYEDAHGGEAYKSPRDISHKAARVLSCRCTS